jgi:hypothetical protein
VRASLSSVETSVQLQLAVRSGAEHTKSSSLSSRGAHWSKETTAATGQIAIPTSRDKPGGVQIDPDETNSVRDQDGD